MGSATVSGNAHAVYWALDCPVPNVPTALVVDDATLTSLTAHWTAPSGPPVTSYTLRWRIDPAGDWTEIPGILTTSHTVDMLDPCTKYDFAVKAVNDCGDGPWTDPVENETLCDRVSGGGGGGFLCGWRGLCGINWNGLALVGDKFSNVIGLSDFTLFTEFGNGMRMLITTPPLHDDRKRIFVPRFEIEVEAGEGLPDFPTSPPLMVLDYSKDGGKTFVPLQQFRSMGAAGEYFKRLRWLNLGQARTWIFRLSYTDASRPAIIGTYVDTYKGLG